MQEFQAVPERKEAGELRLNGRPVSLEWLPDEPAVKRLVLRFRVEPNDPGIAPHFPERQLIAGYMQLGWIAQSLAALCPEQRISRIEDCKFLSAVEPPAALELELRLSEGGARLDAVLREQSIIRTKARVSLNPA